MFYQEDICWCNQNQGSPYTIINRQHGVTRKVSYDSLMRSSQAVPAHLERERERERPFSQNKGGPPAGKKHRAGDMRQAEIPQQQIVR
jgi:hypothetical protein